MIEKQLPLPPASPPPYDDGGAVSPNAAIGNRVNYCHIRETNRAVEGTWAVDTQLRIPPALMPKSKGKAKPDNIYLYSQNGRISAVISLLPVASEKPEKALLSAESWNGPIVISVTSRNGNRFRLNVQNRNGTVSVGVPRDFYGPIQFSTRNGKMRFSDGVGASTVLFRQDWKNGLAFIGDFASSGYGNETEGGQIKWDGDELDLSTWNSDIRVFYSDEEMHP